MALEPDSPLGKMRKVINSVRPDRPDLAKAFKDEDLLKLVAAGFKRADQFQKVTVEELDSLGLPPARVDNLKPDPGEVAATTDNALRQKVDAGLAELHAGLAGLKIRLQCAMGQQTCTSGTTLGRSIEEMPSFQKAPTASELLPLPTADQWAAVFAALGLPEQLDTNDWVNLLYPRMLSAWRSEKHKHKNGLCYASSTPPFSSDQMPGPKEQVQLAVGYILRVLQSAGMTMLHWRDTSRCGVNNSHYKSSFTGFVTHAEVWTSVGVVIEVTDELSGSKMSQALGRIILMMQEQFSAQASREKAFAVAIGRDSVDTVVATRLDTRVVTYRHTKKHTLSLDRESVGLQHLVAAVIATAEVYQVNIKRRKRRTSKAAILKICSPWLVSREASNLKRLKERGLADRCTKVVESGQVSEGMSYLILQPVGKQLSQDEDAMAILKLGKGLVENVALWHKHGLVHRDLSVSNVGLADDGDVLIWDFATMASVSATHGPREPGRWTGTWLYMAISVQQGGAWTLSSELECIFYILIGLSLEDGAVHWRKSWPGDSDAKIAAMMDARTFDAKVLQRTRHQLRPLVQALHDLFFPLASTFVTGPSAPKSIQTTGSFYRTNVRAEEFLDTLAGCEKNLMTSTPASGDEHAKITDACEDGKKETAAAKCKLVQRKAPKRERTVEGSREGPARKKVKAVAQPKTMHIAALTQDASQDKRRRMRKANAAAAQIGRRPHT